MQLSVTVNPKAILSKVSRMFDNTPESIIRELVQNARRAGATKVYVDLCKKDMIMIEHDGKPLNEEDFKAMFSLGDTGWKDETLAEDPAGCGFFISTLFDRIAIHSKDLKDKDAMWEVVATKNDLMTMGSKIQTAKLVSGFPDDVNVRLTLYGKHNITGDNVRHVAEHSPIRIVCDYLHSSGTVTHEDEPSYLENFLKGNHDMKGIECDMTLNNVRYILMSDSYKQKVKNGRYKHSFLNYHGHVSDMHDELDTILKGLYEHHEGEPFTQYDSLLLVIPLEKSDVRMVLPARHSIIQNDAYHQMLKDAKHVIASYVNTRKTHRLPYEVYELLGGKGVIDHEAVMPDNVRTRDKDAVVLPRNPDHIINYLMELEDLKAVVFHNSGKYKGYSWYKKLPWVERTDIKVMVDGVNITDESYKKWPDSGLVDRISVEIDDKVVLEPETVLCPEDDYGFYGSQPVDLSFYSIRTDDYSADKIIDQFTDYIMEAWEPSDDYDTDHPETQEDDFRATLAEWLHLAFKPDAKVAENLRHFFDDHGWHIDASLDECLMLGRKGEKSFKIQATGSFYGAKISELPDGGIKEARTLLNKIIKEGTRGFECIQVKPKELRRLRKLLG